MIELNTTPEREGILSEIHTERLRQDRQWGGPAHDDEHTSGDWAGLVSSQLHCARVAELNNRAEEFRERLIKIAALAVAAIEAHDRRNS